MAAAVITFRVARPRPNIAESLFSPYAPMTKRSAEVSATAANMARPRPRAVSLAPLKL